MGYIILKYKDFNVNNFSLIKEEIEYGHSFTINKHGEDIHSSFNNTNSWTTFSHTKDNELLIEINDDFLVESNIFEKIIVSFLYNLLDFGPIYLDSIDFSNSNFHTILSCKEPVSLPFKKYPIIGTIFKPYYHLSLNKKVILANSLIDAGIDLIKEDETYLVPKNQILKESEIIQSKLGNRGSYIPNVTTYLNDHKFIESLYSNGTKIVLIDFLVTGFSQIYEFKKMFPQMFIWGHRVGYTLLENYISMKALSMLSIYSGINFLHVGTTVNESIRINQLEYIENLRNINSEFIPIFTKITPKLSTELVNIFGQKIILMTCGYIFDSFNKSIDIKKVNKLINTIKL